MHPNSPLLKIASALWLACLVACGPKVVAHPISLTDVIFDVREDHVRVRLGMAVEDLVLHYELKANKQYRIASDTLKEAADKYREFLEPRLQLRTADGELLPVDFQSMNLAQLPEEGVLQTELKTRWITYQWKFPTPTKPQFITIRHEFGESQPASMDCLLLHNGFLAERPRQLTSGESYTLELDWKNPPTKRPNYTAIKAHREKQLRKRLGISSYSALYSFLYITPREVRHEVLIPLLTLERWVPVERKDPDFVEVAEQKAAAVKLAAFFRNHNEVRINGNPVEAHLDRLSFFGLEIRDFALNAPPRRMSAYQARVGVILSYRPEDPVGDLKLRWETYNKFAPLLKSMVFVQERQPFGHIFVEDSPLFEFELPSENVERPTPVRVGLDTPRLSSELANKVAGKVLSQVFKAINGTSDSQVYDHLSVVVDDSLIRDVFLKIKQALLVAEQGGALLWVREVTVTDATPSHKKGHVTIDLTWEVVGSVEHWGHLHTRTDQYQGTVVLMAKPDGWKLRQFEVLDQQQNSLETALRD
jgi:hypothetical protein